MGTTKIGLIRVLTIKDEKARNLHGRIIERIFPGLRVLSECIPNAPTGLHNFETEQRAIPEIVELGRILEAKGVKGIIISCANDPGVKQLRKLVKVPVIGAGSSCASLASIFGDRIGILGITELPPTPIIQVLGAKFVAYEKPAGIKTTLDLRKNKQAIFKSIERLKDQALEGLALGCTGFASSGLVSGLSREFKGPVIDPVVASGLYAYYATLKQSMGEKFENTFETSY